MVAIPAGARVAPWQVFSKTTQDCPVCGGNRDDRRRRGIRCKGYLSADEVYAFCSREEHAGQLSPNRNGDYKHRIAGGPCECGQSHGIGTITPTPAPAPIRKTEPARVEWKRGPFPRTLRDGATYAAEWHYHDAGGRRIFSVVRYRVPDGDKTYKQCRWREDGQAWAWGLGDVVPVLYQLPALLEAPAHRPVFIAEGEKGVDALRSLGLVATCNPMGAGKWAMVAAAASEALRGRAVIVFADKDTPGRSHGSSVAANLAGVARSVRVLEAPEGHHDVADWIAAGATERDVYELVIAMLAEQAADNGREPAASLGENQVDFHQQVAALKAANVEMNHRLRWDERVAAVPTSTLRASDAKVALVLRRALERREDRMAADGMVWVPLGALAEEAGLSASTVGTSIDNLVAVGAFRKTPFTGENDAGERVPRVALGYGPNLATPEQWARPDGPRQQGGARKGAGRPRKCKECGSTHVVVVDRTIRYTTCHNCGTVEQEQIGPDRAVPIDPSQADTKVHESGNSLDENQVDFERPAADVEVADVQDIPPSADPYTRKLLPVDTAPACTYPTHAHAWEPRPPSQGGGLICGVCHPRVVPFRATSTTPPSGTASAG